MKLSKVKTTKVTKIYSDIESLIPNTALSLISLYGKMVWSTIIDDLYNFGYAIPYTETEFIEEKWAEWSEQQSSLLSSNIEKRLITTLVLTA